MGVQKDKWQIGKLDAELSHVSRHHIDQVRQKMVKLRKSATRTTRTIFTGPHPSKFGFLARPFSPLSSPPFIPAFSPPKPHVVEDVEDEVQDVNVEDNLDGVKDAVCDVTADGKVMFCRVDVEEVGTESPQRTPLGNRVADGDGKVPVKS